MGECRRSSNPCRRYPAELVTNSPVIQPGGHCSYIHATRLRPHMPQVPNRPTHDVPLCSVSDMGDFAIELPDIERSRKRPDCLEVKTVNEPSLASRFTEVDSSAAQAIVSTEGKAIGI